MSRLLKWGIAVCLVFISLSLLSHWLTPYDPWQRFEAFQSPDHEHYLGTNDMGHDILSELLAGTRISLMVGLIAAAVSSIIGLIMGLISGYFRGRLHSLVQAVTDIFLVIPKIPILILLTAFARPDYWLVAIILGILWWPSTSLVTAGKTRQLREAGFVESARCLGFGHVHIIFSEILPNLEKVILAKFLINLATAMTAEASISFLGLGDPATKSWGMMIHFAFAKGGFFNNLWWWYLPPGFCIVIIVGVVMWLGFRMESPRPDSILALKKW
jgi:peptide/nickel transport system permease protein